MSSSLFDLLNQQLGGQAIELIGRSLGTDSATAQKAVPAALATLMGGLAGNAAKPDGASALLGALTRDHDGSVLDNIGGMLSNPGAGPGAGILRHVFGGRQQTVEAGLSQQTGLDAGSIGKLLTMLAPLVMGALGKTQRSRGLDAGALASMLGGERRHISKAGPDLGVLGQLLDADGDGQVADDVAKMGAGLLGKLLKR